MTLVEAVLVGAGALLLLALVLLVARVVRRRAAAERAALEDGLRRSQQQVEALAERVEELSEQVRTARRASDAAADREYVITTLAEATLTTREESGPRATSPLDVEQRVVEGLGRLDDRTLVGRRVAEAGVSLLATVHGVRRALRPEHLDRAAAEAHVARRRSRRVRRQELREAKRLLRAVKAQRTVRVEDAA